MCRAAATRVEQSTFFNPTNLSVRLGRTTITKLALRPMLRGLSIQGRDQLLGRWGHGNRSGQNDFPRWNLPAVDTAVLTIVLADCGAFKGDSTKKATRPFVRPDFGTRSCARIGLSSSAAMAPTPH